MSVHAGGQGVAGRADTAVVELDDGLEEEDSTGLEGAADVVDKLIIVAILLLRAGGAADGRLANVPEALAADARETAMGEDVSEDAEDVA